MIDTRPGSATPKVTFCSSVSEASGEDTAGSAWPLRRIVLVELPLPWPYNVLEARHAPPGLADLLYEIWDTDGDATGMIGIAPDPEYSVDGKRRVIDLRQKGALAATYEREEFLLPADEVVDHLRTLAIDPRHPSLDAHRQTQPGETRDMLVCTHGAIDACCATFGYPVYKLLRAMATDSPSPTRVWRSTHFGGHRFAPTVLDLPHGRYWGHLKAGMLSSLVRRTGPVRTLRRHYRGWAALAHPLWQVAEAKVFATAGWAWNDTVITAITGEVSAEAGGTLTAAFQHPAGNGEVTIELRSIGSVQTLDTSGSTELREAPQYAARIVDQHPKRCLDRIAGDLDQVARGR